MPLDFPNSPSTNDTFTSGGITWKYDGAKWRLLAGSGTPTYETSLPGSPVDGQEIYYAADATNGVIWHLRYRSGGGTYKWEFVGGSPLYQTGLDRSVTNQTAFATVGQNASTTGSLPTDPISVTLPLAGEYLVEQNATLFVAVGTAARFVALSAAITNSSDIVQTAASDSNGPAIESGGFSSPSGNMAAAVYQRHIYTVTTAGWKLWEQFRTGGNYTGQAWRRRFSVTPVRVG